jgi:hypothetical protein
VKAILFIDDGFLVTLSGALQGWICESWLVQQLKDESRIPARQVDACIGLNDRAGAFSRGLHDELVNGDTDQSCGLFQLVHDGLRHARRDPAALDCGFRAHECLLLRVVDEIVVGVVGSMKS